MGTGFNKFKKKYQESIFRKTVLGGASVGFLVFAVLMTLVKQRIWNVSLTVPALIALGSMLLSGALLFLLLRPRDMKLAKLLDDQLVLHEKTQTAVAFRDKEGDMVSMQRQDAEEKLAALPKKAFKIRHFFVYIIVFAVSVSLLAVAFALPAKGEDLPPEEPIESLTEWQRMALEELIETVKASKMEENAKAEVVKDLEALRDKLLVGFTDSEMRASVIGVIVETRELLSTINTYKPVTDSLKTSSVSTVLRLGMVLSQLNNSAFKNELRLVRELYATLEEEELTTHLVALATSLDAAIGKAEGPEGDPFLVAMTELKNAIATLNDERAANSDAWAQGRLDEAFGAAEISVEPALLQQYYDKDTCLTVEKRLIEIFGINASELPKVETEGEKGEDGKDEDYDQDDSSDLNTDGGIGEGGIAMGSNDEFYDHGGVGYTPYSDAEVFGRYEAHLDTLKRDGEVDNSIRDLLERYFSALRTKKDDEKKD